MVVAYAHLVSLFIVSYVALAYGASPACIEAHRLHSHGLLQRDLCAQALGGPKVALLFLDGGHMPFEELWRRWFVDIAGLAYSGCRRPGNYSEACKQTSSDTDPRPEPALVHGVALVHVARAFMCVGRYCTPMALGALVS